MRRNKWVWACYGATLAIVLAVATLPMSSWTFKNHVDVLTGGWQSQGPFSESWIYPVRLLNRHGGAPDFKPAWAKEKSFPGWTNFQTIVANAHAKPSDPAAQAHVLRWSFQVHDHLTEGDPPPGLDGMPLKEVKLEALKAGERGTKLDPDNAFFWTMLAVRKEQMGDRAACTRMLERAASCTRFDDYANQEIAERYNALLNDTGYRGEAAHEAVTSQMTLPHLGALVGFATGLKMEPQTKEIVQMEANLLRIEDVLQRTSPHPIGILAASGIQRRMLVPSAPQRGKRDSMKIAPFASDFVDKQRKVGIVNPYDPTHAAQVSDRLGTYYFELTRDSSEPLMSALGFVATATAPTFLLALLISVVVAVGASKMNPAWDLPGRLLPFLLAGTGFWLSAVHDSREGAPVSAYAALLFTVGMLVLGLMQFSKTLARPALIAGAIACAAIAIPGYSTATGYIPPTVFLATLLLRRLRVKASVAGLGAALLTSALAISLLYVKIVLQRTDDVWLAATFSACLVAAVLLVTNGSPKLIKAAPVVSLVLALGYLGAVARQLQQNQMVGASIDAWNTQADLMRAKAGLPAVQSRVTGSSSM